MIINLNELREKIKLIPKSCDIAFVSIIHDDEVGVDYLNFECYKDHSNIYHCINITELE